MRGAVIVAMVLMTAATAGAQQRPATAARPATPAAAAPGSGTRIGIVNMQAVLSQTPGYAAAESTFSKEFADMQAKVAKLRAALDSTAEDLEKRSVMLKPSERDAKRKELQDSARKAEEEAGQMQRRLQNRERELLQPIQQRVMAIIEGVRAEGNFGLILDVAALGSAIVAGDPTLDVTPRVLERVKGAN